MVVVVMVVGWVWCGSDVEMVHLFKDFFCSVKKVVMNRGKGTFWWAQVLISSCQLAAYVRVSYGRIPVYEDRIWSVWVTNDRSILLVDFSRKQSCSHCLLNDKVNIHKQKTVKL